VKKIVLLGVLLAASGSAFANSGSHNNCFLFCGASVPKQPAAAPSGPTPAPEIDPASAMSGFALLAGGLAALRGRRLKNAQK
jgi:hypothetical protein